MLAIYDSSPHPNYDAETAAARIGVAIPFVVSARIWWTRSLDRTWLKFTVLRLLVLMVGLWIATSASRFGERFVFFWWAPPLSVSVLLVELLGASGQRQRENAPTRERTGG